MKKDYISLIDRIDKQGRFWFAGRSRKLSEDEAKGMKFISLKETRPKRIVYLDGVEMPWGNYLKYRKSSK